MTPEPLAVTAGVSQGEVLDPKPGWATVQRLSAPFLRIPEAINQWRRARPNWVGYVRSLEAATELAEQHRAFDCVHYSDCLSRAAYENWRGFSCLHCSEAPKAVPTLELDPWSRPFELEGRFAGIVKIGRPRR